MREAMATGLIDMIATPVQGNRLPPNLRWCADNGCFGGGYPGDEAWLAWLGSYTPEERSRCAFAVAPDVVGEPAATLARSEAWLPHIRALGYPAALAAQDGLERLPIDDLWETFDVLFIGGSTEWKLGAGARALVAEAKTRRKWVHMGRVNSEKRFRYAAAIGCDSADGTFLAFGPDRLLRDVRAWVRSLDQLAIEVG